MMQKFVLAAVAAISFVGADRAEALTISYDTIISNSSFPDFTVGEDVTVSFFVDSTTLMGSIEISSDSALYSDNVLFSPILNSSAFLFDIDSQFNPAAIFDDDAMEGQSFSQFIQKIQTGNNTSITSISIRATPVGDNFFLTSGARDIDVMVSAVPIPASLLFLLTGIAGLGFMSRHKSTTA